MSDLSATCVGRAITAEAGRASPHFARSCPALSIGFLACAKLHCARNVEGFARIFKAATLDRDVHRVRTPVICRPKSGRFHEHSHWWSREGEEGRKRRNITTVWREESTSSLLPCPLSRYTLVLRATNQRSENTNILVITIIIIINHAFLNSLSSNHSVAHPRRHMAAFARDFGVGERPAPDHTTSAHVTTHACELFGTARQEGHRWTA